MNVTGDSGYNVQLQYQVAEDRVLRFSNDMLYSIDCNG
jgi:hypothetical protein